MEFSSHGLKCVCVDVCVHVCYGVQQVDRTSDALLTVAASLQINTHTLTAVKTHFNVSLHCFYQEDLTAENRPSVRPTCICQSSFMSNITRILFINLLFCIMYTKFQ